MAHLCDAPAGNRCDAICLAQFMVILDVSIVNVALPSIRTGLHFGTTGHPHDLVAKTS
jgi:hypothetical protein